MFNQKFKLIGFTRTPALSANVMVFSTGKIIRMGLTELAQSEISDDLNKNENREIYRKLYGSAGVKTAYDMSDRNEKSWNAYFIVCMFLAVIFICSNVAGVKPVEIDLINLTIPAAIFAYPLTFILVDILNEFYGLKMARRAIFLTFSSNICFVFLLWATTIMPSLDEWDMSYAYNKFVSDITSVLIASSVSYLISENINSYLLCKIKYLTNSKFLYIRVITSTAAAAAVDSVLFITIAFYGVFDQTIIERMIIAQFIIKMIYAIIGVIPIYGSRCLFNKYIHPQEKRKDIAYGS